MNRIVFLNKIPIFTLCFILMSIKFDSHKKYLTAVGIQTISLKNTRFLQRSYCESQILTSFSPFHVHTEKLAHCTDCREGLDVLPFKYQTQWCLGGLSVFLLLLFFFLYNTGRASTKETSAEPKSTLQEAGLC